MAELDLFGLLQGRVSVLRSDAEAGSPPTYGVTVGVVTDIDDDKNLGRIKVRFPWLSDLVESAWARMAAPWAGHKRGSYFLPEVGDEVLVAFRDGNLGYPYIIGTLWNEKDPPPQATPLRNVRGLTSKRGHALLFDDTEKKGKVTLASEGKLEIALDDAAERITIRNGPTTTVSIEISGKSDSPRICITASKGDITLNAPKGKVSIKGQTVAIEAEQNLTIDGNPVHINPPGGVR